MKVLAVADIHLQGGFDSEEARALAKTVEIATSEQVDLVLVNGDIYEARSTVEQRLVFQRFIKDLDVNNIPVVVLRGNHDEAGDLLIFANDDSCMVHEQPGLELIHTNGQTLQVLTVPHFNAGAIALQEETVTDLEETATSVFSRILDGLFQNVRSYDGPSLVAFHGTISGAALDNGYIPRQNGIHLNLDRLVAIGCPVIGGHYHRCQEVGYEGSNVWYSGSITRQTFGEADGDKGVLIFEYTDGQWQRPRFVSLNPTPIILIDAEFMETCGGTDTYFHFYGEGPEGLCWNDEAAKPHYRGAKVRFRYRVKQSHLAMLDLDPVINFFKEAEVNEFKTEQIVEVTTAVRNEEITKVESVEDCFRVWAEAKGESGEVINAALEVLNDLTNGKEPDPGIAAPTDPVQVDLFAESGKKELFHAL